jgi:cytochrome P450
MRALMGGNLLNLPHEQWLPRRRALQPILTKRHVPRYAGHVAAAAQRVVDGWRDGPAVDLDSECRNLTLRALGRSVFGVDLDHRADELGVALRVSMQWVADRVTRPSKCAAVAAHSRPARRAPGQRHAAPAGRRNPARRSRRP